MKKSVITAVAVLFVLFISAITTITDGSWDDGNIWSSGVAPTAVDDVIVPRFVTIGEVSECHNLTLTGADAMGLQAR